VASLPARAGDNLKIKLLLLSNFREQPLVVMRLDQGLERVLDLTVLVLTALSTVFG
jgi:hypothetical protein